MKVKVKFLQSGESPDFGVFEEGDEKELDETTAQVLKARGIVEFAVNSALREEQVPSTSFPLPSRERGGGEGRDRSHSALKDSALKKSAIEKED